MDIQIGKITHYYDKIGVGVLEITGQPVKVGDTIKISGHDNEFTQTVSSMQIEHNAVEEVKKGDTVGLKIDQPVKKGDTVYLLSG